MNVASEKKTKFSAIECVECSQSQRRGSTVGPRQETWQSVAGSELADAASRAIPSAARLTRPNTHTTTVERL